MEANRIPDVSELTQALVRLPSENPHGREDDVQDHLATLFKAHDIAVERVLTPAGRSSLIARLEGATDGPGLLLSGHADVVPVSSEEASAWLDPPYAGVIRHGKLFGRGSTDMKGGLAAGALALITQAKTGHKPHVDLVFCASADEEDRMTGIRSLLKHPWLRRVRHALIMEPTDLRIASESFGRTFGTLTFHGAQAHGSQRAIGANPIERAVNFLARLQAYDIASRLAAPGSFWQPLAIQAGTEPAIVPDHCTVLLDARIAYPANPDNVWHTVGELIGDENIEVNILDKRSPWRSAPDDRLLTIVRALHRGDTMTFAGSTDGNILAKHGIAPLILGPGTLALAHRANESVELNALEKAYRLYVAVLAQFAKP